jgi:ATP-binding cassette subfamily B protein
LAGNLAAKVHDVTTGVPTAVAIFLYDYFVNFLLFVVACITLWRVYTWLALSVVLWSLLTILMAILTTRPSLRLAGHAAEKFSQIPAHITDVFNNVLTTRLFAAQAHTLRRLHHLQNKYVQSSHRYRWFALKFYTLQGISFQLYQGLCMLLLVRMHTRGTVTAGEFAMILSTNLIITESLWKMFERMQTLNTLGGKISQALKVLLTPSYIQDKPHATSLIVNAGAICFKHVTFGYKKTSCLFHNQTVHIAARQKIGLVGCSGSGKTTFINLIARLYDVDSGAILIDGQDIRDVTQRSLHKAMAVVTQDSTLFHSTILENIRYGNPDATDSQIIEAAKGACAHTFIMQLPQQYETHVGAQGLCLSGGQRQRIAIARALLQDAPIVLLDEVSAHLDTATEQALNDSLAACLHDKTVLTISHKLTTLQQMDRMLVFDNGKIVEDGSHHQLLAQGGYYATLWGVSGKELLFMRNNQPTQ